MNLINSLKQIPDPRQAQGKRYPLWLILIIAIVAVICGAKSYSEISEWGKNHIKTIKESLEIKIRTVPCASTFYNILATIDVKIFENIIYEYIGEKSDKKDAIAFDGKTMRGTRKKGGEFCHLLSAFSHKLAGTLFQISVESKTNEITAIQEILKKMNLEGKITTMDALLTQTEIAKTIIEQKGDYVMIVKDNHAELKEDIEFIITGEEKFGDKLKKDYTMGKGHGRIEYRQISICPADFIDYWIGAKQVFKIDRAISKKRVTSFETVYGITSLNTSPKHLLDLVRGHWGIENKSHWVRDVVFDEDRSQVENSNIAQFMASFRNLAITLIRLFVSNKISESIRFLNSKPELAFNLVLAKH